MKILLINDNPVVSRLTALSARKEDVEIDEIQEVTELQSDKYDIIFIDSESWTKDVSDVISENVKSKKLVLFYVDGEEEERKHFDVSILKPFLPSEVSAVIRSLESNEETLESDLFELNPLDSVTPIDDKKDEISFDDKLEEAFPVANTTLEDDLFNNNDKIDFDLDELTPTKEVSSKKEEIKIEEDDLFDLDLTDTSSSFNDTPQQEEKEVKEEKVEQEEKVLDLTLDDNILEPINDTKEESASMSLDNELVLEVDKPLEVEPKILDKSEIENIKGILEDDGASDDMTLDQLMPAIPTLEVSKEKAEKEKVKTEKVKKEKVKKEKSKKIENEDEFDGGSNVLMDSLASMPVESLKELLSGTKINIQIKFPKSK